MSRFATAVVSDFYHGTSIEAAMSIQATGFRVDLSGTNAGAMLGPGLYITTDIAKALHYASTNPAKGAIFKLKVDLGRCYKLKSAQDPLRRTWQDHGYDSCYSSAGMLQTQPAGLEENCLKDPSPPRCVIMEVILPQTGEARRLGYEVDTDGKLVDRNRPQDRAAELHRTTTTDDRELSRVLQALDALQGGTTVGATVGTTSAGVAGRGNGLCGDPADAVRTIQSVLSVVRKTWPQAGWDDEDDFNQHVNADMLLRATEANPCVVAKRLSGRESAALVAAYHRSNLRASHGLSCRFTRDRRAVVVFHYGSSSSSGVSSAVSRCPAGHTLTSYTTPRTGFAYCDVCRRECHNHRHAASSAASQI